jgi:ribosomal protein S21
MPSTNQQYAAGARVPAPAPRQSSQTGVRAPRRGEHDKVSEVIIHDDENFERALRRFKKKCEKAGILSDLRKHRHYEKPSERRKRKENAARRKQRRPRVI